MRLGKTIKRRQSDGRLILERRMVGLVQLLVLDQRACTGCRDCETICPPKAITSSAPLVRCGVLEAPVTMDIREEACQFCGLCVVLCPTKALSWRENEEEVPAVQRTGILPLLPEEIAIHLEECRADCLLACEKSCPVKALRVQMATAGDTTELLVASVEADKRRCFYCHRCEEACPYGAISVRSAREGLVLFHPEECPEGCHACADICPSGALYREDGQVKLNERFCIFCRSCQNLCPVENAIEVRRERILHGPTRSHLWVEMQGKLVSKAAKLRLMFETAHRKRERAYRTRID